MYFVFIHEDAEGASSTRDLDKNTIYDIGRWLSHQRDWIGFYVASHTGPVSGRSGVVGLADNPIRFD